MRRLALLVFALSCGRPAARHTCPADATCASLGFACGELRCTDDGTFDTSDCLELIANATVAVAPPRETTGWSADPSMSADGTRIAFGSYADNLVPGDRNAAGDVFIRDLSTGRTERASVSTTGGDPNGVSFAPALSGDGRTVVFLSEATNLTTDDTNDSTDLFVHRFDTGVTIRIDLHGEFGGYLSSVSYDGTRVAFDADAPDLVPEDTNDARDDFVYDVESGTLVRASVGDAENEADLASWNPSLSGDGSKVAFDSYSTNLVSDDTNTYHDVFVRNLVAQTTERVSLAWDQAQGDGDSGGACISADGTRVAFWSDAGNLVTADTNQTGDLFVRDLALGTTVRASLAWDGTPVDNLWGQFAISADGTALAFESESLAIDPRANGNPLIYVRLLDAGTTMLASVGPDGSVDDRSTNLFSPVTIRGDGLAVAFASNGTNLGPDENSVEDVYLRDLAAKTTTRISLRDPSTGVDPPQPDGAAYRSPTIAGRTVAFASHATNLIADDRNGLDDLFLWRTGKSAAFLRAAPEPDTSWQFVDDVALSADVSTLAWTVRWRQGESILHSLMIRDLASGTVSEFAAAGLAGGPYRSVSNAAVSADGRWCAVSGDSVNVVLIDRATGTGTVVSTPMGGGTANGGSWSPTIGDDGSTLAFLSYASNLVPGHDNDALDIFVRSANDLDRVTDDVEARPLDAYTPIALSGDARFIAYVGDTVGQARIFILDLDTRIVTPVSVAWDGGEADGPSSDPSISSDGRFVAFDSSATNLVPDDTNGQPDVFVKDRLTGTTWRVSIGRDGAESDSASTIPRISPDGRRVAFVSHATNLVDDTAGLAVPRVLVAPICPSSEGE